MTQRELLLMRHGKGSPRGDGGDAERPIKDRGKRDAQRIGVWLSQHELLPDHVLASPAERALVSAQKACKAGGLTGGHAVADPRLYPGSRQALLEVLAGCPPAAQRVLVVAHRPALAGLLDHLVGAVVPRLPTGSLVRLAMPATWERLPAGCARVLGRVEGRALPRRFPYPAPRGSGRRRRPAYYYTQSGVVPYRWREGRLEVMVIGSSKRGHPVLPKGIQDPGLTARASAAKEAQEEAGVEGVVGDDALGAYQQDKWGGTCTVTMYPMRVTRVLPDAEWEERHRQRHWRPPEEAAAALREPALAPMVLALAARLAGEGEACPGSSWRSCHTGRTTSTPEAGTSKD